jgi:hypothetical protein
VRFFSPGLGVARPFFAGDHKDRDRAVSDGFFGDASQKDMFYSRSTVRAHHDNIDIFRPSELKDLLIFATGFGDDFDFGLILDLAKILIVVFLSQIFLNGCLDLVKILFVGVQRRIVLIGDVRYHVQDIENSLVSLGNAKGIIESTIRIFREIGTEEHFFVFWILNHFFLLSQAFPLKTERSFGHPAQPPGVQALDEEPVGSLT